MGLGDPALVFGNAATASRRSGRRDSIDHCNAVLAPRNPVSPARIPHGPFPWRVAFANFINCRCETISKVYKVADLRMTRLSSYLRRSYVRVRPLFSPDHYLCGIPPILNE
jgi:hypothetical protein